MIAGWQEWAEPHAEAPHDFRNQLSHLSASLLLAGKREDRKPRAAVLGRIDGPDWLLKQENGDAQRAYVAALERWGEAADENLAGNYAAIAHMPDGSWRLARSPWDAPPLHFHCDRRQFVAAPLLRLIFAAGVPKHLDYDRIVDQLAYDFRDGEAHSWYRGVHAVPLGSVVQCTADSWRMNAWYDPAKFIPSSPVAPKDAPERAYALLREAARHAVRASHKPAIALSGGLDSPLAACAVLDELPSDGVLPSITFRPDPSWSGADAPGTMSDEAPLVRAFAGMHPRLDPHFVKRDMERAEEHNRELLRAMQLFAPGLANVEAFHQVFATAKALGRDTLFVADLANQSFSQDGRWAYIEYSRTGRWSELIGLLRNRPGDGRSLLRKLLALTVLPQLPAGARQGLRSLVHPARRNMVGLISPLAASAIEAQAERAKGRGSGSDWADFTHANGRAGAVRHDHFAAGGEKADVMLAFESIYGVKRRDVTAYRPLIEYCIGLPTQCYASEGAERRLAREMARGRMPESQRLNTAYGQHNPDWHLRIGRQRDEYRAALITMRDHPFLGSVLDIDRLDHLLANWPEQGGHDIEKDWPRMLAIPRAMLAAQFISLIEGRNDL